MNPTLDLFLFILVIAGVHLVPFFVAYRRAMRGNIKTGRSSLIWDIVGVPASLISVVFMLMLFADHEPNPSLGNMASWYVIMCVATAGLVPAFMFFCFYHSGRMFGKYRLWRMRQTASTTRFGRPAE